MTEEHKKIYLAGLQSQIATGKKNIEDWRNISEAGFNHTDEPFPLPLYVDATADIQQVINSIQAIINKLQIGIDYINDTPADELTIELIQDKMY